MREDLVVVAADIITLVKQPKYAVDHDRTVQIEVPCQYYGMESLKELQKFIKQAKRALKASITE